MALVDQIPASPDGRGRFQPTIYEFAYIEGATYSPWELRFNGETYRISESTKKVAEILLKTDTPLSRREVLDVYGVDVSAYVRKALDKLGLLRKYQKPFNSSNEGRTL